MLRTEVEGCESSINCEMALNYTLFYTLFMEPLKCLYDLTYDKLNDNMFFSEHLRHTIN